jgi:hypothetical protein
MNNNFLPYQLKKNAEQASNLATQLAHIGTQVTSQGGDSKGIQSSLTALQTSLNGSGDVLIPLGTFKLDGKVYFNNPALLKGVKGSLINQVNTSTDFDFQIASKDVELERVSIQNTTGNNMLTLAANTSNFKLYKSKLNAQGTAVYFGVMNLNDIYIDGCDISGQWYGILMDSQCQSGQNLLITNSKIYAEKSDAIEINLPNSANVESVFHSIRIIGNTLSTGLTGTTTQAGFAIAVANGKNVVIEGNTITQSRLEAIHIEDAQSRLVVNCNVAEECNDSGLKLYQATSITPSIIGKPAIVTNNQFKKAVGKWNTNYGIYNELALADISHNGIEGFNQGIFVAGNGTFNMNNNTINNCNVGIEIVKDAEIIGTNFVMNTPLLAQGGRNAVFGKIISNTTPTKLLRYYDTTNRRGATLKGFKFPTAAPSPFTAGTTTPVNLFLLPDYMYGTLRVTLNQSDETLGTWAFAEATVQYVNGTLTVTPLFKSLHGAIDFSGNYFVVNNGYLAANIYTPNAITLGSLDVNFDGDYTVQTYSAS